MREVGWVLAGATIALTGALTAGWSCLDASDPAASLGRALDAWRAASAVAHVGAVAMLAAAVRATARGEAGWRGAVGFAVAWCWYVVATLLVWGAYGDAIHHFKVAHGLWQGEFSGAVLWMIVAWPSAALITAVAYVVARVAGRSAPS